MYEPVNRDNVLEGAKLAFGQPVETRYDFSKADVIVSLDADFLYAGFPGNVRYIRDFAKRRNPDRQHEPAVRDREHADVDGGEGGSSAGRCGLRIFEAFARALQSGGEGSSGPARNQRDVLVRRSGGPRRLIADRAWWLRAITSRPAVHALAHCMNAKLGNVGKTVFYTEPGRCQSGQPDRFDQGSSRRHQCR